MVDGPRTRVVVRSPDPPFAVRCFWHFAVLAMVVGPYDVLWMCVDRGYACRLSLARIMPYAAEVVCAKKGSPCLLR